MVIVRHVPHGIHNATDDFPVVLVIDIKVQVFHVVVLYLQEFDSMEHFKQELIEYIDYYNNKRIKARLKGLPPALHRQQALSAA